MRTLTNEEICATAGGTVLGTISAVLTGAAAISGGLAVVPTPATPALAAFSALTGILAAGAALLDSNYPQVSDAGNDDYYDPYEYDGSYGVDFG